jgi:hypothetical protein
MTIDNTIPLYGFFFLHLKYQNLSVPCRQVCAYLTSRYINKKSNKLEVLSF